MQFLFIEIGIHVRHLMHLEADITVECALKNQIHQDKQHVHYNIVLCRFES